ncbi:MAG: hypothetical protein ABGY75_15000 [Gemmataceae bacterium]
MEPIPEDVRQFLDRSIESIDQLEVLRVLGDDREAEWTAGQLGEVVQADPAAVSGHVAALHARGLLAAEKKGTDWVCRYGPRADLEPQVVRLLQCYRERPVSMIKLVYARANDPLRSFADAFRLRGEGG